MSTPHLFISYSHEDAAEIEENIRWLRSQGFSISYDREIVPGTDWRERIANDLMRSSAVVFFSSKHSNQSKHCLAEMGFALDLDKSTIVIKIDEVELAPGLRMYLGGQQSLNRYEGGRVEFEKSLLAAIKAIAEKSSGPVELDQPRDAILIVDEIVNLSDLPELDALLESCLEYTAAYNAFVEYSDRPDRALANDRVLQISLNVIAESSEYDIEVKISWVDTDGREGKEEFECERDPVKVVDAFCRAVGSALQVSASLTTAALRDAVLDADTKDFHAMDLFLKGMAAHRTEKNFEALEYCERAIECDPEFVIALRSAANDAVNLGDRKKARDLYARAIKLHDRLPKNQQHATRAWYYLQFGDFRKSASEWKLYVPGSAVDRNMMLGNQAIALLYAREVEEALAASKATIKANDDYFSQANLAMYMMYAGDFEAAESKLFDIGVRGTTFQVATTMGICQTMLGRTEEGKRIYESLILGNQVQRSAGFIGIADLLARSGSYESASETLVEAGLDGTNPLSRVMLGYAGIYASLAHMEVPRALDDVLRGEIDVGADKPVTYLLGRAAVLSRHPEATNLISSLSAQFDVDARVYANLLMAESSLLEGVYAEVATFTEKANEMLDTWMSHWLLGQAYLRGGAAMDAYMEFETCLRRRGEGAAIMLDEIPTTHLVSSAANLCQQAKDAF